MACNYYEVSLGEFTDTIKDHVKYMHIVDAKDIDGEGLQIGDGEINFKHFVKLLNQSNIKAGFILNMAGA